jgi:hypothetical protein
MFHWRSTLLTMSALSDAVRHELDSTMEAPVVRTTRSSKEQHSTLKRSSP